ncbi:acyl-CoA desaturase [Arthrobacter sp. AQ5-05]|uniref:fatty acid desaturase family protein n=1 Tax=Arthrobacter sp. AQ5-05 TaxID=2184581 RepID=UPI003369E885
MGRRTGHYLMLTVILTVLLGAAVTGFFLLGESWFQLLIAAGLGIILTQFAFLTHEAAHRQIFTSGPANDRFGKFLANIVVGISYQWWMNKHSKHHAMPNTIGKDPDIEWDTISFQTEDAQKQKGFLKWITERQGYLFFPLLTLEGINLHRHSLVYLFTGERVKARGREITSILLRLGIYLAVLFIFLPAGMAAAFLGVQMAVFGVYMGASFAPNHKGMPMIPKGSRIDFFSRQVLTSRNVMARTTWGNVFLTALYGGLNYQVEHHLFPSMPRANLAAVAHIVREYCDELKVPYTVATPKQSYAQVISHLNKVGLSARDPFECPMVDEYRPY